MDGPARRSLNVWPNPLSFLGVALSGCGQAPLSDIALNSSNAAIATAVSTPMPTPIPTRSPNFDEREGDVYFYTTAVSEEGRAKGQAVGDVIAYRYLGQSNGLHQLESVRENGSRISLSECRTDCRVIKMTAGGTGDRLPFSTKSVIGSAFDDAINGRLEVAKKSAQRREPATAENAQANAIPDAFVGEWNADLTACGTGLSDSRLRVERHRMRFYESDGKVTSVTLHNDRAVTVQATYSGERQVWRDSDRLVLSRSGSELTIEGFTRYRCP